MQKYTVQFSSSAEKTYLEIYESAAECIQRGDVLNPRVTLLRAADEVIDKVIPRDPFGKNKGLASPLAEVFLVSKEGLRVFYVASPHESRILVVVRISESPRKHVHPRHTEALILQMVLSGQLDHVLKNMGFQVAFPISPSQTH